MPQVTFQKVAAGTFDVLVDGSKSKFVIVNGSLGLSGRDSRNIYGIGWGSNVKWIGSLAACKKLVSTWIRYPR